MKLIRAVFDNVRDSAIKGLGLSSAHQRLDSTHIISNIRVRGRVVLFSNTLDHFLNSLSEDQFSRVPKAIQEWHAEPEGWFGLGPAEQKAKLDELAQYLYDLVVLFEKDLAEKEPYMLRTPLLGTVPDKQRIQVEVKKKTEGAALQSPYDPDASCGHKGAGYSLHVTETCNNDKAEIITDYEVHGAARSDIGKALSVHRTLRCGRIEARDALCRRWVSFRSFCIEDHRARHRLQSPVNRHRLSDEIMGRDLFTFDPKGHAANVPWAMRLPTTAS